MKRIIVFCLIMILALGTANAYALNSNLETEEVNFKITEPYDYPIVPKTEEWNELQDHMKMIEVCTIPNDILNRMTTQALMETVANYPLLVDMLVWDDNQTGYELVKEHFNGLQEFAEREDASEVLQTYMESFDSVVLYVNNSDASRIVVETCLELIAADVQGTEGVLSSLTNNAVEVTNNNVVTPNNTRVPHYENLTYADHGTTLSRVQAEEELLQEYYTPIVAIKDVSPSYNCHSYAWHSTSSSNTNWIDDPSAYWLDNSYTEIATPTNGCQVVYLDAYGSVSGYTPIHSAIVLSTYDNPIESIVLSKWGYGAVYQHKLRICPYWYEAEEIKYYS
ncbi:MAG: hypothetical protein IJB73_05325 [Firmicutes bacterium]|nr:hypothetical protein [Bacillota bacterium]